MLFQVSLRISGEETLPQDFTRVNRCRDQSPAAADRFESREIVLVFDSASSEQVDRRQIEFRFFDQVG